MSAPFVRGALPALALLSLAPDAVLAWSCTGEGVPQVVCDQTACTVIEDPTPVGVTFGTDGALSACMGSGCWEGPAALTTAGNLVIAIARSAVWIHDPAMTADVAVTLDTTLGAAALVAGGFVTPLRCREAD